VPLLIDHLLQRIARERGREVPTMSRQVQDLLVRHPWPGNVRQLENTLQRLSLLAGDRPIVVSDLESDELSRVVAPAASADRSRFSLEDGVRDQLRRALEAAGGNRERAARLLGISRATIYRKIKDLGL
jgi:two-component system response regulator HydG